MSDPVVFCSRDASHAAALVEKQRMRSALQETPGAIGDLNDALRDVIAELEASVETKIEASFGSTQSTIDSTVSHFPFKHTVP